MTYASPWIETDSRISAAPLAGSFDAVPVADPVLGAVGAAEKVCAVLGEEAAGHCVEGHGEVAALVEVRVDLAGFRTAHEACLCRFPTGRRSTAVGWGPMLPTGKRTWRFMGSLRGRCGGLGRSRVRAPATEGP